MDVNGKAVLITGGGGGIGAGIAEAFVEKGARVAITDINREFAETEAARIGRGVIALHHDVCSPDSWADVKRRVEDELGPVDVLCNNAGVALKFRALDEVTYDEFDRVMRINVNGVFNGCKAFVPDMKARTCGHVVNTSSLNGLLPHGPFATYCASKFAVAGLSEALRIELEPHGIGVSILYPGLTRSRMAQAQGADFDAATRQAIETRMMDAVWLGRAVVRAVEDNTQHIVTHPATLPQLQARFASIVEAHGEPAQPGYVGMSFSKD